MRRVLFNLHLYLALTAGVFIVILGATGAIMAFETELDHVLHPRLSYVTPRGTRLPLAEVGAAVEKAFPGQRIGGFLFPTEPNLSYGVLLDSEAVAVDPYTGEILGTRAGGPDFLGRVHQLHLRLLLQNRGDAGKTIMSWAGVAILFLGLSGLYLWWPYQRLRISKGARGFRFWFDLHNCVGVLSLVFLVVLSSTGVMIGFEEHTVPVFYRMTGSEPAKRPGRAPAPPPGAKAISLDEAVAIAARAIPGATPFQINVPGPRGGYYQIRSHFPEDLTPGGRSAVILDPYSGKVLFAEGSRTAPAGARMVIQNRAIHTGDIFGIPSKTVASLMCLAMVAQVVSGFSMWWKRGRKQWR